MNDPERKANRFLFKFGFVLHADLVAFDPPPWLNDGRCGPKYRVSLMRKESEVMIEFSYWTSFAEHIEDHRPTEYEILSCLALDAKLPESVEEIVRARGSSVAFAIGAVLHGRWVRGFFSTEELEELLGLLPVDD